MRYGPTDQATQSDDTGALTRAAAADELEFGRKASLWCVALLVSGKSIVLCNWLAKTVKRMERDKHVRIWAVYANRSLHKLLRESVEVVLEQSLERRTISEAEFPLGESVAASCQRIVLAGILPSASLSMDDFEFNYDRAAEEYLNRQDATELLPRCSALFIDEAQDMGPSTLKLLLSVVETNRRGRPE